MTYATDRKTVAELQQQYLSRGGEVKKLPTHAPGTGSIRFNFRRRDFSKTHDYLVWALGEDKTYFSMAVQKVADVDAAIEAFQVAYPNATIDKIHEVR